MTDFAVLPPEVNSARMYSGPGSGPMVAAASAWNGLAAELRSTAMSYGSVLTSLTGEEWHGPASGAMSAAATPYVTWMSTTATQAEETAAQAEAAAAAYQAAFTATVPPPVIAANRTQLATLVATNILGLNTPAIAATEAQYAEMWAQDAAAMYGYAGSSAVASQLTAFVTPQQTTNSNGAAAQSAAVTQATSAGAQQTTLQQLMSALPNALQSMASPASLDSPLSDLEGVVAGGWNPFASGSSGVSTGLDGILNEFSGSDTAFGQFMNANVLNTIFSSGFYMPSNTLAPFLGLGGEAAGEAANSAEGAAAAAGDAVAGPVAGLEGLGSAVSGNLGHAAMIGPLSVPPSWTAPSPLSGPLASSLGGTPMIAPQPAMAAGMPPVPLGTGAQGLGRAIPQYGFRPTFVARPPAAG